MKNRLGWMSHEEVTAVANDLGVSREDVLVMEQRLNAMDTSYDAPDADDHDDFHTAPERYLFNANEDPSVLLENDSTSDLGREKLMFALEQLDERSQDILQQRWLSEDKLTLHDLAKNTVYLLNVFDN